jgi:hypothetical protein
MGSAMAAHEHAHTRTRVAKHARSWTAAGALALIATGLAVKDRGTHQGKVLGKEHCPCNTTRSVPPHGRTHHVVIRHLILSDDLQGYEPEPRIRSRLQGSCCDGASLMRK